jgi:predicted acetyltransferase
MALSFDPIEPSTLEALDAVLGPALHFTGGGMLDFMRDSIGVENMRAVRRDGQIVGGLGALPIGQWYGGRSVPIAAVTAVGIAPGVRGTGVGAFMLRSSLEELHATHVPLAVLFPATLTYYRGAGYERAGYRLTYEMPLSLIQVRNIDNSLILEPFDAADYPAIRAVYAEQAARESGNLERPEWLWQLRLEPKVNPVFRYLVRRGDTIEGYLVYSHGSRQDPIRIRDMVALTPAAGRRFLSLLSTYQSMVDMALWNGGPLDSLVYLLSENLTGGSKSRVSIQSSYDWMLRIVDVAGAIAARGYPYELNATLELQVLDPLLPDNNQNFIIEIANGRASVTRGGAGRITIGIRELAVLYTGFMHPQELRRFGHIHGSDTELAVLGSVFGGPRPWMADIF